MCMRRQLIRVVSVLVLVILAELASAPVFAEDILLKASVGTGIMYGVAKEIVYNTSAFNGKSYTLSELDWEIKPLVYTKAALALSTNVGFVASLDIRMGIPGKAGLATDSDWLNYNSNGDMTQTNYSQGDCYTERAILLDARAGWKFPLGDWLGLEPFFAFEFMDFKWTSRDGYLQYPPGYLAKTAKLPYPDYSTQPRVPFSGAAIIYQQTYFIPAVGIAAKFSAGKDFGVSASFTFSPLAFCNDVDNHLAGQQTRDFYDYLRGGFLVDPKVSLEWRVSGTARLSLDVSYRHIEGLQGDTHIVDTGIGFDPNQAGTTSSGAGASFDALDASLNITWNL